MTLDDKSTNSILAGLRLLQQEIEAGRELPCHFDHFDECDLPSSDFIDSLCESINLDSVEIH